MPEMPVALLEWRAVRKNTLRGFATIRLGKSLRIKDVAIHTSNGKRWASFPSKPVLDQQGVQTKDERGKNRFAPLLEWLDRDSADRFSEGVIACVEREYPNATGE